MRSSTLVGVVLVVAVALGPGCATKTSPPATPPSDAGVPGDDIASVEAGSSEDSAAAQKQDALAIYEALEAELAAGGDAGDEVGKRRRQDAYERIAALPDDGTAAYAFARAAVAGRVAQARGLSAIAQVKEAERFARRSLERDEDYRGGAAQRLLGTMYVMAGKHTEHGDSERGLELLEALAERHPEDPVNHVRLGEAYVSLGDPEGAFEPLCRALDGRDELPAEERRLLDQLVADLGGVEVLACAG